MIMVLSWRDNPIINKKFFLIIIEKLDRIADLSLAIFVII